MGNANDDMRCHEVRWSEIGARERKHVHDALVLACCNVRGKLV